jgi:hypothetical protein
MFIPDSEAMSLETKIAIAGVVLTAVGIFIAWLQLRKQDPPTASLNKSTAKGSAIISGDYNQVVIHPAGMPQETQPQLLAPRTESPKPNIRYIDASTYSLKDYPLDEPAPPNALIVRFANDARPGIKNVKVSVRATLIYLDGGKEICAVTGNWLNDERDYTQFEVNGRHTLLVGLVLKGELQAPTKYKTFAHKREIFQIENKPLVNFKTGVVVVQLTEEYGGDLLFEKQFEIRLDPLSIAPAIYRNVDAYTGDEALADEILSYASRMKLKDPNRAFQEPILCIEFNVTSKQVARAMDNLFIRGRAKHTGFPGVWQIYP